MSKPLVNSTKLIRRWGLRKVYLPCPNCGQIFNRFPSQITTENRCCSFKCRFEYAKKLGNKIGRPFSKGHKPHYMGKKFPFEIRQKMKANHADFRGEKHPLWGKHRSQEMKESLSKLWRDRWRLPDWRKKLLKGLAKRNFNGEKNPNWKGGYEPYYGPNWLSQREKALRRDGAKCRVCFTTKNIQVHHIIPFRETELKNYEKANELDNLITLCLRCHRKYESKEVPLPVLR